MSYVYIKSERAGQMGALHDLYTVGFYDPAGKWESESDHAQESDAAARVRWLNGGRDAPVSETTTLKYTDAIVDAPRQLLAYAETPGRTLEGLRIYLRQCGVKFERCWPDWAYENGHLTKGGLAELVHRMMEDVRHG